MENPDLEEARCNFWSAIERYMIGYPIPMYIKNILKLRHIDNRITLKSYDRDIVNELEIFVQSDAYKKMIPPGADLIDYYGFFHANPSAFGFSLGHEALLMRIIKLCKEEEDTFWIMPKSNRGNERKREKLEKLILEYHYNNIENNEFQSHSTLLRMLLRHLADNSDPSKQHRRYTEPFQKFWSYIFLLTGIFAYETLEKNLPIPSTNSLYRFNGKNNPRDIRPLDIAGLKKHLISRNYPLEVWVCDDVTKIKEKVEFDQVTSELYGLVPPLDKNSFPIEGAFKVTSAENVQNYKENYKLAKYLRVFMVQPLTENSIPYCLAMIPSDSSDTTVEDYVKRCSCIREELKKESIIVKGFSSADSDSRTLSAMKIMTKLGEKPIDSKHKIEWFHASYEIDVNYVFDIIHLVNTLKTLLLNHSKALKIGSYIVSSAHLDNMCKNSSKDKHHLLASDLSNDYDDKIESASTLKICHRKVYEALQNVPRSEGTQAYLRVMNFIAHSYLSIKMNILTRVYCITYALFFCRYWQKSLTQINDLSLHDNFISLNTYTSLELNAHAMLKMVLEQIEKPNSEKNFLPYQMNNQPCQAFFKTLQSLHTIFCTVVNYSHLGACQKAHKIKLVGDLVTCDFKKYGEKLNVSKNRVLMSSCKKIEIEQLCVDLGNEELFNSSLSYVALDNVIVKAKVNAYNEICDLGVQNVMIEDCNDIFIETENDHSWKTR
ncbi:hypothetical protein QAD02_009681 [Eretmocerus hayati]|uniref:Uncharacterized protein n=1 Tax=Eretmocerus hayati TaxID=131215 RepID=A0ACC2NA50_9HYME|nr:hypothetical protein QAD02_009681 [Eretmocerus hayati]